MAHAAHRMSAKILPTAPGAFIDVPPFLSSVLCHNDAPHRLADRSCNAYYLHPYYAAVCGHRVLEADGNLLHLSRHLKIVDKIRPQLDPAGKPVYMGFATNVASGAAPRRSPRLANNLANHLAAIAAGPLPDPLPSDTETACVTKLLRSKHPENFTEPAKAARTAELAKIAAFEVLDPPEPFSEVRARAVASGELTAWRSLKVIHRHQVPRTTGERVEA